MKIVVTGSSGFIGHNVVRYLEEKNYKVVSLTRNPTRKNEYNINNSDDIRLALTKAAAVIHCAGISATPKNNSEDEWAEYLNANVNLTKNIALQAQSQNLKKFIFLSTAKVFGEYTKHDIFNNSSKPNPSNFYSKSKLEAEKIIKNICRNTSMSYLIMRPPMVYGLNKNSNFYSLYKLAKKSYPLPFALMNEKRSLIYIKNLTDIILKGIVDDSMSNKTLIVSDSEPLSVKEIIKKINYVHGSRSILLPVPKTLMNILAMLIGKKNQFYSLSKPFLIDNNELLELGWQQKYTFTNGLEEMEKNDEI